MLQDRYGYELSTTSVAARDAYVDGIDRYLAGDAGVEAAFEQALTADPGFALAHIGLARQRQVMGDGRAARTGFAEALSHASGVSAREAAQIDVMGHLFHGRAGDGFAAAQAMLKNYPRDPIVAGACLGVFGLIGFSGRVGREAENLAFAEVLAPHYGEDWWFLGQLAFAQMEAGRTDVAEDTVDRSLAGNPRNSNSAHYKAHHFYEVGEAEAGLAFLDAWRADYPREGLMHCHLAWHVALWSLAKGDVDRMWAVVDADIDPAKGAVPPLNVLTDLAAVLFRAQLAGVEVSPERWRAVSGYAGQVFPKPGLAFADVHAALAHAMAGDGAALARIVSAARGPAGDCVAVLGQSFGAIAALDWTAAAQHLTVAIADHARIGGSRAQRDLIEYAMAHVLLRLGRADEARRVLAMHRPATDYTGAVVGV